MNAEDLVIIFKKNMANLSKTERTVARQLANGVCRNRIRDMFNVLPPYMDYWVASAA